MRRCSSLQSPGISSLGVAESIGTLHPYLLAFQRALELLEHAEFVVSAVDPVFTLDLLEDLLPPSGSDHTFDRNRFRKIAFGGCLNGVG